MVMANKAASSGIEINTAADSTWANLAESLPDNLTINGKEYNTADLSANTKKLLAIYLSDLRIVGEQKEMLALAELGLKALAAEIASTLPDG